MKAIVYINRTLLSAIVLVFLIALSGSDEAFIYGLLGAIPFGVFQVIASLILITFWDKLSKAHREGLIVYYVLVPIYFLAFFILDEYSNRGLNIPFVLFLTFSIPTILAIVLTAIIEGVYNSIE